LALLILGSVAGVTFPALAGEEPAIGFSPAETRVPPGAEFTVELKVSGMARLYGAAVEVKYDPQVIECLGMEDGNVFSEPSLEVKREVNAAEGVLKFAETMLGERDGFNGDGTLVKIKFKALQEGSGKLTIAKSELVDASLADIKAKTEEGIIIAGNPGDQGGGQDNPPGDANQEGSQLGDNNQGGNQPGGGQDNPPGDANQGGGASGGQDNQMGGQQQSQPGGRDDQGAGENGEPAPSVFTDLQGHWAAADIGFLTAKGIIRGYEDRTFRPAQNISRAEFAVIIVRATGMQNTGKKPLPFKDAGKIPGWAAGSVAAAAGNGIFKGDEEGRFRSDDPVTRAEIAAILVRILGREKEVAGYRTESLPFSDTAGSWAGGHIGVALAAHLISGYEDGTFRPAAAAARSEAAVMIVRFLKLSTQ
jgi:hypothetical protein